MSWQASDSHDCMSCSACEMVVELLPIDYCLTKELFYNKLNFSVFIFPQELSCTTKEYYKDMEFRCKHLVTFRSVMPMQTYNWERDSKLIQAKSTQTAIYHKLLSSINFVQPTITFSCFSYLPFGCQ